VQTRAPWSARRHKIRNSRRRQLSAELEAARWQRAGHAIVLHTGPLSRAQTCEVARLHAGPGGVLTAFTAAEDCGLRGWERNEVHVVAAAGTRLRGGCPVPIELHLTGTPPERVPGRPVERLPAALLRAAATFRSPRPACGLLAAAVQQRRADASELRAALELNTRTRHRRVLLAAVHDIEGGSEALSEIDFVRLCRRHGLPEPLRQHVRCDSAGRRRYLDATWCRRDGRLVVVEIDGALHLAPRYWWNDQLRQNELVLTDAMVLPLPERRPAHRGRGGGRATAPRPADGVARDLVQTRAPWSAWLHKIHPRDGAGATSSAGSASSGRAGRTGSCRAAARRA
jgi:hypothetical protein